MEHPIPAREAIRDAMRLRHTPHVQEALLKARVAVCGLGGLGSHIALLLARAGVGHLMLADYDRVDLSNLNRQSYGIRHLGMEKTQALKLQIEEVNPYLEVQTHAVRLNHENAWGLLRGATVICEAFDAPESKAMLADVFASNLGCRSSPDGAGPTQNSEPFYIASSGMAGYESSNLIQTRKLTDRFYICGDERSGIDSDGAPYHLPCLMAPRVAICAGHQANLAVRLILGENAP